MDFINEVVYLDSTNCSIKGLRENFHSGIVDSTFRYRYKENLNEVLDYYGAVKWGQDLYLSIHQDEVIKGMSLFESIEGLANFLKVRPDTLRVFLGRKGFVIDSSSRKSLLLKHKESQLFQGDRLSSIESYFYGYYLGDGTTCRTGNRIDGVRIVCYNTTDKSNFRKIAYYMGIPGSVVDDVDGAISLSIYSKRALEGLSRKGLLYLHKTKGAVDVGSIVKYTDMFMLLRGLIDSDGSMEYRNGRKKAIAISMVNKEIPKMISEFLSNRGLRCGLRKDISRHEGWQDRLKLSFGRATMSQLVAEGIYNEYSDLVLERKSMVL